MWRSWTSWGAASPPPRSWCRARSWSVSPLFSARSRPGCSSGRTADRRSVGEVARGLADPGQELGEAGGLPVGEAAQTEVDGGDRGGGRFHLVPAEVGDLG